MEEIKKGYQGEIASVKEKDNTDRYIHVYQNSSDFPDCEMILMTSQGTKQVERVPITEEIWRATGKALGYRFVIRKTQD